MDQPDDAAREWFPDHIQGVSTVPKAECVADLETMQAAATSHATTMINEVGNYVGENLVDYIAPSLRTHFSLRTNEELKHQSKKARLVEKLLRESNPYHLLRQEHSTLRATLDQVRVDTVNYHDAIIQTKKEASLAVRERDIYERQFQVLRKEFCDAMSATMALRNQYENAIRVAQSSLDESNTLTDTTHTHLSDVRKLTGRIRRLEAEKESVALVGEQLRKDVEQLQALLQHCAALAFDAEGNPVMPYCAVFRTMSDEGLMRVRALMREKIGATSGKTEKSGEDEMSEHADASQTSTSMLAMSTSDVDVKDDISTPKNNTSTDVANLDGAPSVTSASRTDTEGKEDAAMQDYAGTVDVAAAVTASPSGKRKADHISADADMKEESTTISPTSSTSSTSTSSSTSSITHPYYYGATPTGLEGLTAEMAAKLSPLERAQRLDLLCQHQNIVDLTGVFNPGVYFELLRKQADQIIDLQRQCTAEAIKAQEGNEQNTLFQQRLQSVGLHFEETLRQLDAAHSEMILRDGMTTVHGLEMQALQEQAAMLRMTL